MTSHKANVASIAAVFTLAFLAYFTDELIPAVQMIPLILFGLITLVQVFYWKNREEGSSLFSGDGSFYVWSIPWFTLGCSMTSRFDKSPSYWAIDTITLVVARLYLLRVPMVDVLEGFFWGATCSLAVFCFVTYRALVDILFTFKRLEPHGFHPNTLAFILAGFFAVMLWQAMDGNGGKWKRATAATGAVVSVILIFFASSRGSLLAVGTGCLFTSGLYCLRERKVWVPLVCGALLAGALAALSRSSSFEDVFSYTDDVLQLSGGERGWGSGLSGRTETWILIIGELKHGSWIWGNGMRASDGLEASIDNGFIVAIYDMGAIPFLVIVGRALTLLWGFARRYWVSGDASNLLLSLLLIIFLVNNTVERLLFGVGNPLSLLMFLIMANPWPRLGRSPAFAGQTLQAAHSPAG